MLLKVTTAGLRHSLQMSIVFIHLQTCHALLTLKKVDSTDFTRFFVEGVNSKLWQGLCWYYFSHLTQLLYISKQVHSLEVLCQFRFVVLFCLNIHILSCFAAIEAFVTKGRKCSTCFHVTKLTLTLSPLDKVITNRLPFLFFAIEAVEKRKFYLIPLLVVKLM